MACVYPALGFQVKPARLQRTACTATFCRLLGHAGLATLCATRTARDCSDVVDWLQH